MRALDQEDARVICRAGPHLWQCMYTFIFITLQPAQYAVQNICRKSFLTNKLIIPRVFGGTQGLQAEMRKRLPYVEDVKAFGMFRCACYFCIRN